MSSNTRIYTVTHGEEQHLVRATTRNQAVSHVARNTMEVRVATQTDLETLLPAGVQVEVAGKDSSSEEED